MRVREGGETVCTSKKNINFNVADGIVRVCVCVQHIQSTAAAEPASCWILYSLLDIGLSGAL